LNLLSKTTLFFLTIAFFVLFTCGIGFYFLVKSMINREVRTELVTEMHQFMLNPHLLRNADSDSLFAALPYQYRVTKIKNITNQEFQFTDTLLFDAIMQRYQSYRILRYQTDINGQPIRLTMSKSLSISDKLIENVALLIFCLSFIFMFCIVIFNNLFFKKIWGHFFKTIDIIKAYNISDTKEVSLPRSEIAEFDLLNQVFEKMHERIKQDYQNLKEFIENISHEIQTPLAIIKSKIELLTQNEKLDPEQLSLLQAMQTSTIRLSNLNKTLILLSRIDNHQFPSREKVDLQGMIDFHLSNFEDMINAKDIGIRKNYQCPILVLANSDLISILILNLLKNAIYHNHPSGTIDISCDANSLSIKNTGKELEINKEDLFKRFTKSSQKPDSLGLGLAIVKKICDYYHFDINYVYENNHHVITILFESEDKLQELNKH
jgi:signal transduction histidine kinase